MHGHGEREMSARAATTDAEFVGVHVPFRRVVPDEADGAVDVLRDLRNDELRLAAVAHGEDRVAVFEEGGIER